MQHLKLYYVKRKAFINFAQKHSRILWARSHLIMDRKTVETCSLVRRVQMFSLFFRKNVALWLSAPKMKTTIQTVTNEKCKKEPVWWNGGASVPTGDLHICEGTIDGDTYQFIQSFHLEWFNSSKLVDLYLQYIHLLNRFNWIMLWKTKTGF